MFHVKPGNRLFHVEQAPDYAFSPGRPEDLLITSLTAHSTRAGGMPASTASTYSAAAKPAADEGMRRLVSVGEMPLASGVSPNPTIDIRSGTSMPREAQACIIANALISLLQIAAVGAFGNAKRCASCSA